MIGFQRLYPSWLFPGRSQLEPVAPPAAQRISAEPWLSPLRPVSWWRAARRIAALRPDVWLLAWWVPFFAPMALGLCALLRPRGLKPVFVCHNVLPHEGAGPITRLLLRTVLSRGRGWIVHARADEEALRALLPERRLRAGRLRRVLLPTFPLGGTARPPREAARRRFGLPPEAPVLLFFGFVRPYKGLDVLVEALPALRAALPALRLLVAGEFWSSPAPLRARADELRVADALRIEDRYLSEEEAALAFAAADLVVLPYREATQSAVLTVAFDRGLPVVASAVGGLPDAVEQGVTGLLVPPDDPAALAEAILRYFREPGLAARLRAGVAAAGPRFDGRDAVAAVEAMAE